jgi:hypothetical protein
MIPTKSVKGSLPEKFSDLDAVMVFRFGGTGKRSGRIVGTRHDERFHVLFIDRDYTLYDHG